MQYSSAEFNQSRYAQTTGQLKNRASHYSTSMSRGDQQSSRLTRTSSFGQTNIKNKLETFEAILDTLGQELHQLRQDTTDSRSNCSKLNRDMLGQLDSRTKKLLGNTKNMQKFIKAGTDKEDSRTKGLINGCDRLMKSSHDLQMKFDWMKDRLDRLEISMGYYSAVEKYKS